MLFLLILLTTGYFAGVLWVRRTKRRQHQGTELTALPAEDQPPASAVGWPPQGARFTAYVAEGFAALDAYLEEGYAA